MKHDIIVITTVLPFAVYGKYLTFLQAENDILVFGSKVAGNTIIINQKFNAEAYGIFFYIIFDFTLKGQPFALIFSLGDNGIIIIFFKYVANRMLFSMNLRFYAEH